jgi:hypothetical protein
MVYFGTESAFGFENLIAIRIANPKVEVVLKLIL